jgi:cytochrome c oxidase cbb3-type subunit 3
MPWLRAAVPGIAPSVMAIFMTSCCREAPDGSVAHAAPALPPAKLTVGPVPGGQQPPPPGNPLEGDRAAIAEGRRLFIHFNCSGCHGGHAGGGMGPSLRDQDWVYGSDPGHIFNSIAEGRAHGMPSWGTRLPAEQVWQLTAYVTSLGTRGEPDAPQ